MIRVGVICPSEIAFRRFLPALQKANDKIQFTAVGIASPEEWFGDLSNISQDQIDEQQAREYAKARTFIELYGGEIIVGYGALVTSDVVDAVYIPLPPALHYMWAKKALEADKHVFVEKPSTTRLEDTEELIDIASARNLALHENYMFIYHEQIKALYEIVKSGEIGEVRLYRISFGFPLRQLSDFRYNKALGGGALLDAGGYCMKYANYLLGDNAKIITAQANYIEGFEVEMYGSATMVNPAGTVAQLAFGMDNDYKCEIEIWGAKGTITSGRIFTAPAGFTPTYTIKKNQDIEICELPVDDSFFKSIEKFIDCIYNVQERKKEYKILYAQEVLIEQFKLIAIDDNTSKFK
ncbi:Gfo/Idh/MocA family protein [Bacteroides heparinolyticus]|uniref:Gfo/Idh/MocA family protein n=1 Tax=Prevotella heparinolytica TaxID=28113 RepID=UPI0023F4E3F5|nr:Gfo/Idh/MocA family oxidoreductase [Bacteroides heparinolyticus]